MSLGIDIAEYINLHVHKQAAQLKIENTDLKKLEQLKDANTHLKNLMEMDLRAIPSFICNKLINPYHKKHKFTCPCGALPYDTHWPTCEQLLGKLESVPSLKYKT